MRPADDGLRLLIIHGLRAHRGVPVHWVPIESALTASGIPDLYGRWRGRAVWVECKATAHWALPSLTEFQVGFALQEVRAGGRSLVATRRRRADLYDELWVHDGSDAPRLRASGLRAAEPLLRCVGGPGAWDWDAVGRVLFLR
jgi:hypothetical protein